LLRPYISTPVIVRDSPPPRPQPHSQSRASTSLQSQPRSTSTTTLHSPSAQPQNLKVLQSQPRNLQLGPILASTAPIPRAQHSDRCFPLTAAHLGCSLKPHHLATNAPKLHPSISRLAAQTTFTKQRSPSSHNPILTRELCTSLEATLDCNARQPLPCKTAT